MSAGLKFFVRLSTAIGLWVAASAAASAGVLNWNFSYTGLGTSVSGVLTTSDVQLPAFTNGTSNGYAILGITGNRNGVPISGVFPPSGAISSNAGFLYDNVLYSTDPHFDFRGMLYQTQPGNLYNVWFDVGKYWEGYFPENSRVMTVNELTYGGVERVSEPGALALVALALLALFGFGALRIRGRRAP
jgi:hypothetical protein